MKRADIGIVGAGQLARMTVQAAISLDVEIKVLANDPTESAARISNSVEIGSPDDLDAVLKFARSCEVVTFDHELVNPFLLKQLWGNGFEIRPSPHVMTVSQSKRSQRECFERLGLPAPSFCNPKTIAEALAFSAEKGHPVMVKADRGGYDGRGVWKCTSEAEMTKVLVNLLEREIHPVVEEYVVVDRELAMLIARRPNGDIRAYPLVETRQQDGMLKELLAPAEARPIMNQLAEDIATLIAIDLDLVGLMAVELFEVGGSLLVNEIATRPHNSGHFTIEGAVTSQFEQHIRAVLNWPLGDTALTAPFAATANIIGAEGRPPRSAIEQVLSMDGVHLHLYGKEPRPNRKVGHVTSIGEHSDIVLDRVRRAAAILNQEEES